MAMENPIRNDSKGLKNIFSKLNPNHGFYLLPFTMPDKEDHPFSQQLHLGLAWVHHQRAGGHTGNGQAGQIQGAHGWLAAVRRGWVRLRPTGKWAQQPWWQQWLQRQRPWF